MKLRSFILNFFTIAISAILVANSVLPPANETGQIRKYTRMIEFDYITWTVNAFNVKNKQSAANIPDYLDTEQRVLIIKETLRLTNEMQTIQQEIEKIYSDPNITNPFNQSASLRAQLAYLQKKMDYIGPLSETILQQQVSKTVAESGISLGGQLIPPLLYHVTPLPYALIVSPRDAIRQKANISLLTDLTLDQMVALEKQVEENLDVSALVVPIGGVGIYPTMVMSTTSLPFLTDTIAHEWTHNFLTLRPLGVNYDTTPQLRTMNETAASIAGGEIGSAMLQRYYPEYVPSPPVPAPDSQEKPLEPAAPPKFDYRAEMHTTRIEVDALLSAGKIEEAENYMETRRQIFLQNGYAIRRINQAYFAFYGAYADQPGGAAGQDPVGPAVRKLRAQSTNLAEFLNRISWMTSFAQLEKAIQP